MPTKKEESALIPSSDLTDMVALEKDKRTILVQYARDNMIAGVDFHEIKGKKSLGKPGAEKICSLYGVTIGEPEIAKDHFEALPQAVKDRGAIVMLTKLYRKGEYIGSGIGARTLAQDGGDLNKSIKMARKSSIIDAVLSTFGLSDLFTQDLEDMPESEVQTAPRPAPKPAITNSNTNEGDFVETTRSVTFEVKAMETRTGKSGNPYTVLETDIGKITSWKNTADLFKVGHKYSCQVEFKEYNGREYMNIVSRSADIRNISDPGSWDQQTLEEEIPFN